MRHSFWSEKKIKFTEFYGCKKLNSANLNDWEEDTGYWVSVPPSKLHGFHMVRPAQGPS